MRSSYRYIFILFSIVAIFYFMRTGLQTASRPSFFDVPKKLSEEKLTIQVRLHSTPGGAEVWSLSSSGSPDDRLYLQPARPGQTIPLEYYRLKDSGFVLTLYGSFYKGKGIPQQYFNIQPMPERYPVFQYESLDMMKEDL